MDFEDVKNISAVSNRWLPLEMRLGNGRAKLGEGKTEGCTVQRLRELKSW